MAAKAAKITEEIARAMAGRLIELTAKVRKEDAKMNERINAIREQFNADNAEIVGEAKKLETDLAKFFAENQAFFPKEKKSFAWGALQVSKRITPPKVGIPAGTDWDEAIGRLKTIGLSQFVRTIEEVDKEAIIAEVAQDNTGETRSRLSVIGITVTQKEKVNIDVAEESVGEL